MSVLFTWRSLKEPFRYSFGENGTTFRFVYGCQNNSLPPHQSASLFQLLVSIRRKSGLEICFNGNEGIGMMIKPRHKHVDATGLVYMPYLHSWNVQRSNLVELVSHMSSVFSTEPPVFKAPNEPTLQTAQQQGTPQQAYQYPQQQVTSHNQQFHNQGTIASGALGIGDERSQLEERLAGKIQATLQEFRSAAGEQINQLMSQQSRLKQGTTIVEQSVQSFTAEKESKTSQLAKLQEKDSQLQAWLENNATKDTEMNVDKLIVPRDTWSAQYVVIYLRLRCSFGRLFIGT